jgi:ATP-dependent helicase HrpB
VHVADGHLDLLGWSAAARALQHRAGFARRGLGGSWPDVTDDALAATAAEWLEPRLGAAIGRTDLARVDMAGVLRQLLGHRAIAELDRIVPTTFAAPSGRSVPIDYSGDQPSVAIRVQELFGLTTHPSVADGRIPIVVHLLSPAGRDVQVTADLPGFWAGTWSEVRKEMAGRYPRHAWPLDPTVAGARRRDQHGGGRGGRRTGGG